MPPRRLSSASSAPIASSQPARPPHPATVVQPRTPHPATLPHPATVMQARAAQLARPPHPATVAQPRAPHPATVMQRAMASEEKPAGPKLHVVSPGVGVLLPKGSPSGDSFVELIKEQIKKVGKVPVGAALLAEFDPDSKNKFRQVDEDITGGMYKGITVIITPVSKPKEKKKKTPTPLHTTDFYGTSKETGAIYWGDRSKRIPYVQFWDVKLQAYDEGGLKITSNGVEKHADLPADQGVWPLDIVLFHELCHAYLSAIDISESFQSDGKQEEELVTGLKRGTGWRYSENTYRGQLELSPRTSYKGVKLEDPDVVEFKWGDNDETPEEIFKKMGLKGAPWLERTNRWK